MPILGEAIVVKVRCSGKMHRLRVCYGDYTLALLDHTSEEIDTLRVAESLLRSGSGGLGRISDLFNSCRCYEVLRIWEIITKLEKEPPGFLDNFTPTMYVSLPIKLREYARAGEATLQLERKKKLEGDSEQC